MPSATSRRTPRRPSPSGPHGRRVGGAVLAVLVVVISAIVLSGYARARNIPDSSGGPSQPTVTRIPSLGLNVPTVPIHDEGAVLDPPSNPKEAGWWANGAMPGASKGSAVITAHKIHGGGGAFDDLENIKRGALVTVDTQRGVQNYEIVSINQYNREQFAEKSTDLFRTDGDPRLVLITCRDWNGKDWEGNTVVIARPGTST